MTRQQQDFQERYLEHVRSTPLPDLGNPEDKWPTVLSEPEINGIHAFIGFVRAACVTAKYDRYWQHYGPIMEALSDRLCSQTEGANADPPLKKRGTV